MQLLRLNGAYPIDCMGTFQLPVCQASWIFDHYRQLSDQT